MIRSRARLLNTDHELIAEGVCELDEAAGLASLQVERTTAAVQSQRGNLSLELDSGRSLVVADKPMLMTITPPGERPTPENRKRVYRLRIVDPMAAIKQQEAQAAARPGAPGPATNHIAQDASAVGAVGKGRPAVSGMGRLFAEGRGETPAAR